MGHNAQQVNAVLAHFSRDGGEELTSDPHFNEALRVALRVTFLVGWWVETHAIDPTTGDAHAALDMIRDDIRAGVDFFEEIERSITTMSGIETTRWPWVAPLSLDSLAREYRNGIDVLTSSTSALLQRYAALLHLMRLELTLWAQTLGCAADGYVV